MADDERATKHSGPDRSSPYAVSRLSGPVSLVDAAREIERADQWIASTSAAKLEQIAAQMRALREQAERVLAEAQTNADLHRVEARFPRHPGKIYHLYERGPGQRYWSLLSPQDWSGRAPHRYLGSYRLEGDQSWTPLAQLEERDRARAPYQEWLDRGLTASLPTTSAAGEAAATHKENACESSSSPPSEPIDPG